MSENTLFKKTYKLGAQMTVRNKITLLQIVQFEMNKNKN